MENIYWNQKGTHQVALDRLYDLVPAVGKADTTAGEMIRAICKLSHELYNNGMGNNSSGACVFLAQVGAVDVDTFGTVIELTTGDLYRGNYDGDKYQVAMESLMDQCLAHIIANPALETEVNTQDMFDLGEPDMEDEEEDEDWWEDEDEDGYDSDRW